MIRLLGGLVDHFVDAPRRMPPVRDGEVAGAGRRARPRRPRSRSSYVSGMTDRYALGLGVELLGWRPDDLPRGV